MSSAPWSAGDAGARLKLPDGAADCHLHIFDPRFPYLASAHLQPQPATVADYRLLQRRLGTQRAVVVQPSSYGIDNRCTLDAVAQMGDTARAVVVVDGSVTDDELKAMHAAGARGVRFNLSRGSSTSPDMLEPIARRIAPLGWHLQVHTTGDTYADLLSVLSRLPVPIVIDHLGRTPQPGALSHSGFMAVRSLLAAGKAWVKLSGAYLDSLEGAPGYADSGEVVEAFVDTAPDRMVWGTDWPHPSATAGERPLPDDALLLDRLADWLPDEAVRNAILVRNPERLYGFGS